MNGARTDIENEYDSYLGAAPAGAPDAEPAALPARSSPTTTDNVTLTINPILQQAASNALISVSGNNDGAVVVLNPKTGAILAMVSNPTYDPNLLGGHLAVRRNNLAYFTYTQKDHEGFYPLRSIATSEYFEPGSTMKVVTSTAAYNLKPSVIGFDYPVQPCQKFPDSNRLLCNDGSSPSNSVPCGGTMVSMLPESCDPGYGELGVQEGVSTLRQQAELFGINSIPPIDLPAVASNQSVEWSHRSWSRFPPNSQALQAYSAIGQDDGPGHGAAERDGGGRHRQRRSDHDAAPHVVHPRLGRVGRQDVRPDADATVCLGHGGAGGDLPDGERHHQPPGTASGVGFPSYLCAAVKTGTAQTGLGVNHDWMIGFAPANDPQIAVAVVVPYQYIGSDGARIAGTDREQDHADGTSARLGPAAVHGARRRSASGFSH